MTISFLQRKGGCGKTTNAVNVAKELRRRGHKVLLVETDRNYTAKAIKATDSYIAPQSGLTVDHITGKQLTEQGVIAYLKKVQSENFNYIIVDGAAEMSAAVLCGIAQMSNAVIIPSNDDTIEIEGAELTLRDLAPCINSNPHIRLAILPNRIQWLKLQATVQNDFAHLNVPLLPYMPRYKEYRIQTHKNPGGLYRGLVRSIIALQGGVTLTPELSATTAKRHFLKCSFSKCKKGNPAGWFYSDRSDAVACCGSHRVMAGREKEKHSSKTPRMA